MKPITKREKTLIKIKERLTKKAETNNLDIQAENILHSIEMFCQLIFDITLKE